MSPGYSAIVPSGKGGPAVPSPPPRVDFSCGIWSRCCVNAGGRRQNSPALTRRSSEDFKRLAIGRSGSVIRRSLTPQRTSPLSTKPQEFSRLPRSCAYDQGARFLFVFIPIKYRALHESCRFPAESECGTWVLNDMPSRLRKAVGPPSSEVGFIDLTSYYAEAARKGVLAYDADDDHRPRMGKVWQRKLSTSTSHPTGGNERAACAALPRPLSASRRSSTRLPSKSHHCLARLHWRSRRWKFRRQRNSELRTQLREGFGFHYGPWRNFRHGPKSWRWTGREASEPCSLSKISKKGDRLSSRSPKKSVRLRVDRIRFATEVQLAGY